MHEAAGYRMGKCASATNRAGEKPWLDLSSALILSSIPPKDRRLCGLHVCVDQGALPSWMMPHLVTREAGREDFFMGCK